MSVMKDMFQKYEAAKQHKFGGNRRAWCINAFYPEQKESDSQT